MDFRLFSHARRSITRYRIKVAQSVAQGQEVESDSYVS